MLTRNQPTFVLALGSFLLATLALVAAPTKGAQAQTLEDLPDLIVTKVCLTEMGNVGFRIDVTAPDGSIASHPINCGDVLTLPDLAPGTYGVEELLGLPDDSHFVAAIICDGADAVIGTQVDIELEMGADRTCTVYNALFPDEASTTPPAVDGTGGTGSTNVINAPVTIINSNSSINSENSNETGNSSVLDNDNVEENDNINDNTQRQTVERHQSNGSSQD